MSEYVKRPWEEEILTYGASNITVALKGAEVQNLSCLNMSERPPSRYR